MAQVCLALNAGSSSLKFQMFEQEPADERIILFRGMFERLNGSAHFVVKDGEDQKIDEKQWPQDARVDHEAALMHLVGWLQSLKNEHVLAAIGHRVAHGPAEEVLRPETLGEFYGVSVRVHREDDGTIVVVPNRTSLR